jgi:hypothetical protein
VRSTSVEFGCKNQILVNWVGGLRLVCEGGGERLCVCETLNPELMLMYLFYHTGGGDVSKVVEDKDKAKQRRGRGAFFGETLVALAFV